ncbi:MAG: cytochrome c [Gammaproteobacteria bacterium]|nr:cytochrome c [Gammaproteobacteria bacterium]MDH5614708.1 cytochrome c [Gammaproteobacteria bacterium]
MLKKLLVMLFTLISLNAVADEKSSLDEAKALHDQNCTSCHKSMNGDSKSFYTRIDRKIDSLPKLKARVEMCKNNLGLQWFDEEVDAVVNYINSNFYKFK